MLAGGLALAQQPLATDKSNGVTEEFVEEASESEKEEAQRSGVFRRYAPRLLFLEPTYADDLSLPEDLRVEVQIGDQECAKARRLIPREHHG